VKIIRTAGELGKGNRPAAGGICLAIGVFDGVHLGHQQIIRQTVADARQHDGLAVVLTFDHHPNAVISPDHVPPLIYSQAQKNRAIESLGVHALLVLRFDRPFSEQTGETFIRSVARDFGRVQSICVGADFVFGHRRSGNVALLKKLGEELNFRVHGIAAVSLDGQIVSSTRIRDAIGAGDFDSASQMLGRAYALAAKVVEGDKLGQKLGFPTANLDAAGFVLPPNGVYTAQGTVRGRTYRAVLNIGVRPTVERSTLQPRVEAHLLNFTGEIYGEEMEVTFLAKLRDERKFASLEELKSQITRDITEARNRF